MKRNFYLQHPLMAMCDPRMEYLLEKEKLKGTGAYWFVIEKLAMLPDSCGDMKYLRSFCKDYKISFAYLKKIIFGYGLFDFEEDGSFMPAELNPIGQRVQVRKEIDEDKDEKQEETARRNTSKTFKSASETSVFESKNDGKQQKTSQEKKVKSSEESVKTLNDSTIAENYGATNKENIKDIITTASEKEKERTAAADDVDFSNAGSCFPDTESCFPDVTLHHPQCHILASEMPYLIISDATPRTGSSVAFPPFRCGVEGDRVWHSGELPARFAFIAATVHRSDGKIPFCRPETDGGIRVFRSLYSLGNDIFRIGGIHRGSVRAVDDVGRCVAFVIVRGRHPTEVDVSVRLPGDGEAGRGCRWNVVYPRHGGLQGRSGVEVLFQCVVQPLCVVHQVLHTIVSLAGQFMGTGKVHLAFHLVQCPVAFAGIEEVDAQSGDDLASVALFLPVEGERVEMIAAEVKHGIYLVLNSFTQPSLCILIDRVESIPTAGGIP